MFTMPFTAIMAASGGPELHDAVWGSLVLAVATGNDIERSGGAWGPNGGGSSQFMTGDVEATWSINANAVWRYVGLGTVAGDLNPSNTEFSWQMTSSRQFRARVSGVTVYTAANYVAGQSMRISRVGDDVFWYRNDNLGGGWVLEHTELAVGVAADLCLNTTLYSTSPPSECLDATLYGVPA